MSSHLKIPAAVVETNPEMLKSLWRAVGSTVWVVSTEHGGQRFTMLATAVSSLSFEPPALLVCVNRNASAYEAMIARGGFSVGIMAEGGQGVAAGVARGQGDERFTHGAWHVLRDEAPALDGLPWLEEAKATMFCELDQQVDYGTHTVLIGAIKRIASAEPSVAAEPLLYLNGKFGRVAELVG